VVAKAIAIQTPTPGFSAQVYVSDRIDLELPYGDPTQLAKRGWQGPVGSSASVHSGEHIQLTVAGVRHRYYLIWLNTLPPGKQSASIADVTLFR
jgi:hypothetical protein